MGNSKMSLAEIDVILENLWDQDAVAWERYWEPVFAVFARDLVKYASLKRGYVVLDMGTGSGIAAIEARRAAASVGLVVGVDRSDAMIRLARRKAMREGFRNVRFLKMSDEDLAFPNGFFDIAFSNCGIGIASFAESMKEAFRVLGPGGVFVLNDWHLIDVKPHRIFGEVLGRYRTLNPSSRLGCERVALATTESSHRSLDAETQRRIISEVGFKETRLIKRKYAVRLPSIEAFLKMRLCRKTIEREMSEMSPEQRGRFLRELRGQLRQFVVGKSFIFDWNVFYVRAKKALR